MSCVEGYEQMTYMTVSVGGLVGFDGGTTEPLSPNTLNRVFSISEYFKSPISNRRKKAIN